MTIHSRDRASWLTKLNRIAERSVKDRFQVFNNLGHILSIDMLKEQYQRLDGKKALGVDGLSKAEYGEHLESRLEDLVKRIRRGTYRSKPAKLVEIAKEDGGKRPLAISCIEDKLVQQSVNEILQVIYEPIFRRGSYGYRPGRNCHEALKALHQVTYRHPKGAIVEIDLRKYFNTIPHKELMLLLRRKISDRRFLRLIEVLMTAPIQEGKRIRPNKEGCPQGSILSPVLANVYLHYVIDEWFEQIKREHFRGNAEMIRFADDMVFSFECPNDAERFYRVLPKRLAKAGLEMHLGKSRCIKAGRLMAVEAEKRGSRLEVFNFLGFTCYWGKSRNGFWRLKLSSRKDRFTEKLRSMRKYLKERLTTPNTVGELKKVIAVVKGWVNYHAVSDNQRRVSQFLELTKKILYHWLNRKGKKRQVNWEKFSQVMKALNFPRTYRITSMFQDSERQTVERFVGSRMR